MTQDRIRLDRSESVDELLNQEEAAHFLRLSPRTLEDFRHRKTGPPFSRLGKRVIYHRDDLRQWVRQHLVETR